MNNYSTHMLEHYAPSRKSGLLRFSFPKSYDRIESALALLERAEKFIMPDYGRVFQNGTMPEEFADLLRLPAPICALEYFCPRQVHHRDDIRESDYFPKRRIALCVDTSQINMGPRDTNGGIVVLSCFEVADGLWTFSPAMALVNPDTFKIDSKNDQLTFDHYSFIEEVFDRGYAPREAATDLADEVMAAVQFMMTINCENVKRERIDAPAKLNKKREKNGKTPFYSYWLLDVFKDGRVAGTGAGGSHNSPRFHFRRGHIRRYRDEAGNVKFTRFIKRMAVGNATLGRIDKTYNINPMGTSQ